ncbi:MAG: AAC(3) family N-acetyltransferase [Acidimicrobiia bacterium]|nr:AAC(3) family N-acetyltransferase [Acidimicrobiia bacterium]
MLVGDFVELGVRPGTVLVVHSSLSSLGWVCGGPVAVVRALDEVLGPEGTLVVPTHSGGLSDPTGWVAPPVPQPWWEPIRDTMPAFDPHLTPTRMMGAIADCVLRRPGTLRSAHPQVSFAAHGPQAEDVTAGHVLDHRLGEGSPLARLYDHDATVLFLGVGHDRNTSLHLAEYRSDWPGKSTETVGAPVVVDGERRWVTFEDVDLDESDFPAIGAGFAAACAEGVRAGEVGHAVALLVRQRALVDFAVEWMPGHRRGAAR